MKREGDAVTFEHVEYVGAELPVTMIAVQFDGEWDYWGVAKDSTTAEAIEELRQYYGEEWTGTGRTLPVYVMNPEEVNGIDCK